MKTEQVKTKNKSPQSITSTDRINSNKPLVINKKGIIFLKKSNITKKDESASAGIKISSFNSQFSPK